MQNTELIARCAITLANVQIRADQANTLGKTIMDVVAALNDVYKDMMQKEQENATDKGQGQGTAS